MLIHIRNSYFLIKPSTNDKICFYKKNRTQRKHVMYEKRNVKMEQVKQNLNSIGVMHFKHISHVRDILKKII